MRIDPLRLRAAALCCVALILAALAQGCARSAPTPNGGEAPLLSQTPPIGTPTPALPPALKSQLPAPKGFVSDFANVIDEQAESLLEAKLARLRKGAKIEFNVVTVETTGEDDINDYSLALARLWGVGPPTGEDGGGLLLLLAVKDRKWRLQVSDRLRADLPDREAAEIANVMTDSLRAGRYGEAVTRYADGLIERLAERRGFSMHDDEPIPQADSEKKPSPPRRRKP